MMKAIKRGRQRVYKKSWWSKVALHKPRGVLQNHARMISQGHYFLFLLFHSLLRNISFSLPGSTQSFLDMEMDGQCFRTNYTTEISSARTFFPQLFEF
jgi:hypothetical protein